MSMKLNCWEYMQCGREPGGSNTDQDGPCAVASASHYNGTNNGTNAGRFCWKIAGTFCFQTVKGSFAKQALSCLECSFFQEVEMQEGRYFA